MLAFARTKVSAPDAVCKDRFATRYFLYHGDAAPGFCLTDLVQALIDQKHLQLDLFHDSNLLAELSSIVRDTCRTPGQGDDAPTFDLLTTPNEKQRQALGLLESIRM